MRKDVSGLVDTLRASVLEIAASVAENREELLTKSVGEFNTTLEAWLDTRYGADPEVLEKGLNHISSFASALNRMNQTIMAMKTGRPAYMLDSDSSMPPEQLPEEIVAEMDRFMRVGIFTLKLMVNDSAELPEDEADLTRAEKAGELLKIDTGIEGGEILFKSRLPADFHTFFADPVDLMVEAADLGRELTGIAVTTAEALIEDETPFSDELLEAYPEIFGEDPLGKAFPPAKKKPPAGGAAETDPGTDPGTDTDTGAGDEALGAGAADQGQGDQSTDLTDDTPQDPIQMVIRLLTMGVVILGGLAQGAEAGAGDQDTMAGDAQDPNNVGLQRGTPIETTPLAKILSGEIAVEPSLADALMELESLRKGNVSKDDALAKLRETVARLGKVPMQPLGVLKAMPISKSGDSGLPGRRTAEELASEVAELNKRDPEGGSAAKLMIATIHGGGGRPMLPPG